MGNNVLLPATISIRASFRSSWEEDFFGAVLRKMMKEDNWLVEYLWGIYGISMVVSMEYNVWTIYGISLEYLWWYLWWYLWNIYDIMICWWLTKPLWKKWLRQLGWLFWISGNMFQTTNQYCIYPFINIKEIIFLFKLLSHTVDGPAKSESPVD